MKTSEKLWTNAPKIDWKFVVEPFFMQKLTTYEAILEDLESLQNQGKTNIKGCTYHFIKWIQGKDGIPINEAINFLKTQNKEFINNHF
jgi:hypothetical protein